MNDSSKLRGWFFLIIVVIGVYYLISVNGSWNRTEGSVEIRETSQSDVISNELANRYQAVTEWEQDILYTLNAQDKLITDRPILVRGYIEDVFRRNKNVYVRFSSSFSSPINYLLELECNQKSIDKILAQQSENNNYLGIFEEYAVVANVNEVAKPIFTLAGSFDSNNEVNIASEASDLFIIKGTCVDIVYIGSELSKLL